MGKSGCDVNQVVRAVQDRYLDLLDAEIDHLREIRSRMGGSEDRSYDYKMMINSLHRAKELFYQAIEEYLAEDQEKKQ